MDKMEKYNCSIDELNALKFAYYNALYGLHHYKGLKYKNCLEIVKGIKKLIPEAKKHKMCDLLYFYDDSEVLLHENVFNS